MVRLSGPSVVDCLSRCFASTDRCLLDAIRRPQVIAGSLRLSVSDRHAAQTIPCELLLWPGQRSYTRQPSAELHTLGSPPLLEMVLDELCAHGARMAEPGEFTLRAFLAGRIDLTRAEAVLGVIDAASPRQLHSALEQMAGGLSRPLLQLREQLLHLLAELEAGLDFVDEDIEFITREQMLEQLAAAKTVVDAAGSQMASRGDQSAAARVVILGLPNAGKSSLFNALVRVAGGSQAAAHAIVSPQSGTTRDYVTATLTIGEVACELIDTAGDDGHAQAGTIARAAQSASRQQQQRADIRMLCVDASHFACDSSADYGFDAGRADLVVITKADVACSTGRLRNLQAARQSGALPCSSQTGEGLAEVAAAIRELVLGSTASAMTPATGTTAVAATAARCGTSLRATSESLSHTRKLAEQNDGTELIAAELRIALAELGKVVGAVYTDDILDRIFGQFCIGK